MIADLFMWVFSYSFAFVLTSVMMISISVGLGIRAGKSILTALVAAFVGSMAITAITIATHDVLRGVL